MGLGLNLLQYRAGGLRHSVPVTTRSELSPFSQTFERMKICFLLITRVSRPMLYSLIEQYHLKERIDPVCRNS